MTGPKKPDKLQNSGILTQTMKPWTEYQTRTDCSCHRWHSVPTITTPRPHNKLRRLPNSRTHGCSSSTQTPLLCMLLLMPPSPDNIIPILNRHTLGHMINLVNTHQPRRQFKHIIPQ